MINFEVFSQIIVSSGAFVSPVYWLWSLKNSPLREGAFRALFVTQAPADDSDLAQLQTPKNWGCQIWSPRPPRGVRLLTSSAWARGSASWPAQLEWGGSSLDHLKLTPERLICDHLTVYKRVNNKTAAAVASPHTSHFCARSLDGNSIFMECNRGLLRNVRYVQCWWTFRVTF